MEIVLIRYYPMMFFLFMFTIKDSNTKIASALLGLHILVAPFFQSFALLDFFAFYAVWDLLAIPLVLFVDGHIRRLLLVITVSASFYINAYNQLFWDVGETIIYTYYTHINVFLLEVMLAILATHIEGKTKQVITFILASGLFIWLRM